MTTMINATATVALPTTATASQPESRADGGGTGRGAVRAAAWPPSDQCVGATTV